MKLFAKALAASMLVGLGMASPSAAQIKTTGVLHPNTVSPSPAVPVPAASVAEPVRPMVAAPAPEVAPAPTDAGPSVDQGGRLDLMCFGGGSANKASVATAWGFGNFGGLATSSTATVVGQRSQGFADQVSLFVEGDQGRVRMPRTMLPAIRGGENGWFKLKDLEIRPNEITASVAVSAFNNPKLRLDRYTGAISISGKSGDFAGECQRFNPQDAPKAF